jgi:hypothetical protein
VVAKILKVTPMSLLAYAPAIFKASPRALLVSVAGDSFDCRQGLTPSVAAALPAVERFVRGQIAGSKLPAKRRRRKRRLQPLPPCYQLVLVLDLCPSQNSRTRTTTSTRTSW